MTASRRSRTYDAIPAEVRQAIADDVRQGIPVEQVARKHSVHAVSVYRVGIAYGILQPKRYRHRAEGTASDGEHLLDRIRRHRGRKTSGKLSDRQLWIICQNIYSPDPIPVKVLARRFSVDQSDIYYHMQRMRRDGWVCRVYHGMCAVCGGLVLSRMAPRKGDGMVHPRCRPARRAANARVGRRRRGYTSTAHVRNWRERNPERNRILRQREKERARLAWHAQPESERAVDMDRLHEAMAEAQRETRSQATSYRAPWSDDEVRYIVEHPELTNAEIALALGRTLYAVQGRRKALIAAGTMDPRRPPGNRKLEGRKPA